MVLKRGLGAVYDAKVCWIRCGLVHLLETAEALLE